MICIDTTVLIDEFRAGGDPEAPVNRTLRDCGMEDLIVPVTVAGEFLDGAAMVSEKRFQQGLAVLKMRKVVEGDMELAGTYARLVSGLRKSRQLSGVSQNDLWIAATARRYGARFLTRNPSHFQMVPGLEVVVY